MPFLLIIAFVGIISFLLITATAPFKEGLFDTVNPKPDSHAAAPPVDSYTTNFPLTENPISEGGVWVNGKVTGIGWQDVRTTPGKAFGTQSGTSGVYDDTAAVLRGTFGANQEASGTVFNNDTGGDWYSEVEFHLRTTITSNSIAGYEIGWRARNDGSSYCGVVRWNGPLGNFTMLPNQQTGTLCGIKTGDVLRATIIGNTITAYKNGVQLYSVTDNAPIVSGNPGIGFWLRNLSGVGNTANYGFTNFTAQTIAGSTPAPTPAPTPPPTESVFNGPHNLPGTLQLEDYDNGGEGLAYHDLETANQGGGYRTTEGVDVQATTDTGGGFNVGWTMVGEWLKYMVNVTNAGTYNINFRVASQGAGGTFHLEVDGTNVSGTLTVPDTTAWQTFTTITKNNVPLTAGAHVLRLVIDSNGAGGVAGNFNYLTLSPAATPTPAPTPTPVPTPVPTPTPAPVGIPGDIDGNGRVDIFDYNLLVGNFGKPGCGLQGDLDGNCVINIFDYNILVANFGRTS